MPNINMLPINLYHALSLKYFLILRLQIVTLTNRMGAEIVLVSAKTGENMTSLMEKIKHLALSAFKNKEDSQTDNIAILQLLRRRKERKRKC